jgi:D-aminopeptidase
VQSNFGGVLTINGAPVGRELGRFVFQRELAAIPPVHEDRADGSIMIVLATDAPVDARNLDRIARRALSGLARTGASMTNGSGDYVIAFSTAATVRRRAGTTPAATAELPNDALSPIFQAAAEATEEAILNSLFRATTVRSRGTTVEALPLDRTLDILRRYNALRWNESIPPR